VAQLQNQRACALALEAFRHQLTAAVAPAEAEEAAGRSTPTGAGGRTRPELGADTVVAVEPEALRARHLAAHARVREGQGAVARGWRPVWGWGLVSARRSHRPGVFVWVGVGGTIPPKNFMDPPITIPLCKQWAGEGGAGEGGAAAAERGGGSGAVRVADGGVGGRRGAQPAGVPARGGGGASARVGPSPAAGGA
jgi:hypothetical protein